MKRFKNILTLITLGILLCSCTFTADYKKFGFRDVEELNIFEVYPFAKCRPLAENAVKIKRSNYPAYLVTNIYKEINYVCDDGYGLRMSAEGTHTGGGHVTLQYALYEPSSALYMRYYFDLIRAYYPRYLSRSLDMRSLSPKALEMLNHNATDEVVWKASTSIEEKMSPDCTPKEDYGPKESVRILRKCFDELKGCIKTHPIAAEFIKKIIVEPQVINESGFDAGDKKVDVTISFPDDCPIYLDKVDYLVEIKPSYSDFVTITEPNSYDLKYNSDGYNLKPTVRLLSKKFQDIFPDAIIEDDFLKIKLNKITARRDYKGIAFYLDIVNKSLRHIDVKSISLYVNDSVLTTSFVRKNFPPQTRDSLTLEVLDINPKEPEIFQRAFDAIKVNLTRETAEKKPITVGLATKFEIDGKTQTLFKSFSYNHSSLLDDN